MQKIQFSDGEKISSAKVTIDGVDYLVTPSYYEGATPLTALVLNQMQTNIENEVTVEKQTQVAESFEISDSAGVQGSINIVNGKTSQGSNPSPDSPQEIENVGDNINLFDKSNYDVFNGYFDKTSVTSHSSHRTIYMPCKSNTTYTVQKINKGNNKRFYLGSAAVIPEAGSGKDIQYIGDVERDNLTITTRTNDQYLYIWCYVTNDTGVTFDEILDSLKVEEGAEATGYTAYNCGSIDIETKNKNLVDISKFVKGRLDNGAIGYKDNTTSMIIGENSITFTIDAAYRGVASDFIKVKSLTTYQWRYISAIGIHISYYDKDKLFLSSGGLNGTTKQNTTPSNCKYMRFYFYEDTAGTYTVSNLQIEEGTTATDYVPYQEELITFPLAEGQELCKIGTYSDKIVKRNGKWYIEKNVRKLDLAIADMNNSEDYPGWGDVTQVKEDYPNVNSNFEALGITFKSNITNNGLGIGINTNSTNQRLFLRKDFFDLTKTQWQTNYPDLVFTIYYGLQTPYYEELTSDQLQALDKLLNAQMYQEKTYIDCLDEVKPDLQVQYLYDNDINNYYGKRLDEVEITINNKLDADLVDDTSSTNKFVTSSDKTTWSGKQDALVSGTNIKTINNESLLGSGNITIQGGGSSITVHDSYDTSTTEPYSCNYINTVVGDIETLLSQI